MATGHVLSNPFSCRDAIHHLCKRSKVPQTFILKELEVYLDDPLLVLCKKHLYVMFELLKLCQVPLCIIGRKKNAHNVLHACLVDVRHLDTIFYKKNVGSLYWIIDMQTGHFVKETTKKEKIPTLNYHYSKQQRLQASIWDILQVDDETNQPEPQTLKELVFVLEKYNLLTQTNVFYCISIIPKQIIPWLINYTDTPNAPICFEAYTKSDLSIGYAFRQPEKLDLHNLPLFNYEPDPLDEPPDASTANRRTSVSVKLSGLTLAHSLGFLSKDDLLQINTAMSKCVGSLWLTCDEKRHVRHVLYKDASVVESIEITCSSNNVAWNEKKWTQLLKTVASRGKIYQQEKASILSELMEKLKVMKSTKHNSLWVTCFQQLQLAIKKFKVFCFCNDDTFLHHLKVPVAGVYKAPRSKGVYIQMLANHTITALSTSSIVFINLAEYFNHFGKMFDPHQDDDILWKVAHDWLNNGHFKQWKNPEIQHNISFLKHHPKMEGESPSYYVLKRAERNCIIILQLWSTLVKYLMQEFTYDLSCQPHLSLSKLSFDIVWQKYAAQAGPLAHAIENIHPFTEYMLRPWCRGGFSYSFESFLERGSALDKNKEVAQSIQELDLTSAYGYSGMTMAAAKGFGIAFGSGVKTQKRYTTFEYRATMYTIYKLNMMEGHEIKSVFSNYSPLGLVYIGKHALDLVVVLSNGDVKMYQFDGHFCHGDYRREHQDCPTLPYYANDKSRQECEKKTMERDEAILNWMLQAGSIITCSYDVITDCCDREYFSDNLKKAFFIYHSLAELTSGLSTLNGTLQNINYDEVTFLAIVHGKATVNHEGEFGPIFASRDDENNVTVTQGRLLLTSDYYRYLKNNFGFQVDKIEWIIFYKRCHDMPKVFYKLVQMRQSVEKGSAKDAFLKTIVNYACGYFGLNVSKQGKMSARIAYKLPKRFNIARDHVKFLGYFNNEILSVVQTYSKTARGMCKTPLILFVQIIEFGKQRLNKSIQCLQKHLRPSAMRILYSNVDNLIIALSSDTFYDAIKNQTNDGRHQFTKEWLQIFGQGPGMLKQEWFYSSWEPWQFVSPVCMFHVLKTQSENNSRYKSCFVTGLPVSTAFNIAMALLKKQKIQVPQERKVDKILNSDTHIVQCTF